MNKIKPNYCVSCGTDLNNNHVSLGDTNEKNKSK